MRRASGGVYSITRGGVIVSASMLIMLLPTVQSVAESNAPTVGLIEEGRSCGGIAPAYDRCGFLTYSGTWMAGPVHMGGRGTPMGAGSNFTGVLYVSAFDAFWPALHWYVVRCELVDGLGGCLPYTWGPTFEPFFDGYVRISARADGVGEWKAFLGSIACPPACASAAASVGA